MCSIPCGCISKGVSFLLPIVYYYLKELCDAITKFKGVLACYKCFLAPYNLFIMAYYILYVVAYKLSLCMQSGSDAPNIQLS